MASLLIGAVLYLGGALCGIFYNEKQQEDQKHAVDAKEIELLESFF